MKYDSNSYKVLKTEASKEDDDLLLINFNISSGQHTNIQTRNNNNSLSDNDIQKIFKSNYSFSEKTIGNEISKTHFESIEEELLTKDKILNKILNKKDKPIYLSHSDYYYCPNSKTEKNLNDQIMKYLYENNLITKKNQKKTKNISNIFYIINNNFDANYKKKYLFTESKILQNINDNKVNQIKEQKVDYKLKINDNNSTASPINNNKNEYIEKMKRRKKLNTQINQINNIKIKNIYITNNENINNHKKGNIFNKSKEKLYGLKNSKIFNSKEKLGKNKISFNNKLFGYKQTSNNQNKINKENPGKEKIKNNKMKANNNKIKNKSFDYKRNIYTKESNKGINKNRNYEISSNIVNEEIICKNENNNNKKISDLSTVSLQSINDSKLLVLAEDLIQKDGDFDKF